MLNLLDGPPVGNCIHIVRHLFLQKLPAEMQLRLATVDPNCSLQELATFADRICKAKPLPTADIPSQVSHIIDHTSNNNLTPASLSHVNESVNALRQPPPTENAYILSQLQVLQNTIMDLTTRSVSYT